MNRLIFVCIAFVLSALLIHVGPVGACSGLPYYYWSFGSTFDDLNTYETVVAGRIYALSDSGVNAVLEIDQVIEGDTSEKYILFFRKNPTILVEDRGIMPCDYSMGEHLPLGKRFVAALWHNEDGIYWGPIFTETADGLFRADNPDQRTEALTFTYDELIAYISKWSSPSLVE